MAARRAPFLLCIAAVLVTGLIGCAGPSTSTTSATETTGTSAAEPTTSNDAPVPPEYQSLVTTLTDGLDAYQRAVDALPDPPDGQVAPVLATELLPADGNRLTDLLQPTTMPGVDAWLDRLASLGVRGITLGVKLPMLLPQFGPDGENYTRFYETVADKARAHGMVVDVELGALFCGTVYAKCSYQYPGGYQSVVDATVAQARIVIDRIEPDYLTILSEPTTEETLAKVPEFGTPEGTANYVHDVLTGLGDRGTTRVGAGAAAWLDPGYNELILHEPVDYLDLHMYPVTSRTVDNLLTDTRLARQAGVPVVADEVGLYKTDGTEQASPATADTVFRRDAFSFFEPYDIRFATITSEWANKSGIAYVSPFWAGQFFSYLEWTPALDAAPFAQLNEALSADIRQAFAENQLTDYGRTWLDSL